MSNYTDSFASGKRLYVKIIKSPITKEIILTIISIVIKRRF
jgi:hypothetical protein